jgi:hypothetical protein
MKTRTKIAIRLIFTHMVLVAGLVFASLFVHKCGFLFLSVAQTILLIVLFSGYWEFFGLRFKQIFCSVMELFLVGVLACKLVGGLNSHTNIYMLIILSVIQAYLLYVLIRIIIVIFKKDDLSMEIEFPFKNGIFLITDGGNSRISRMMNYHYYSPIHKKNKTNLSMLYATDIVRTDYKIPKWLPGKNEDYPVFGENIYSPIEGQIVKVENLIPDNEPYAESFPYNTGNTIVIQHDDFYLVLGHLKQNSILVKAGDTVKAGDLIGSVGNSGWTERPHTHIQLIKSDSIHYWSGTGVEIRFRNRPFFKNMVIRN